MNAHKCAVTRQRIQTFIEKNLTQPALPRFWVVMTGDQIEVSFLLSAVCNVLNLITDFVSRLGAKSDRDGFSYMPVGSFRSGESLELMFVTPDLDKMRKLPGGRHLYQQEQLLVSIFDSVYRVGLKTISFTKAGEFNEKEIETISMAIIGASEGLPKTSVFGQSNKPLNYAAQAEELMMPDNCQATIGQIQAAAMSAARYVNGQKEGEGSRERKKGGIKFETFSSLVKAFDIDSSSDSD